jgi:hypothetical protein
VPKNNSLFDSFFDMAAVKETGVFREPLVDKKCF